MANHRRQWVRCGERRISNRRAKNGRAKWLRFIIQPTNRIAVQLRAYAIDDRRIDAKAMGANDAAAACPTIIAAVEAHAECGRAIDVGAPACRLAWRTESDQLELNRRGWSRVVEQQRPSAVTLRRHALPRPVSHLVDGLLHRDGDGGDHEHAAHLELPRYG